MTDKDKIIAELKAENAEIKTSYINFVARLKAEMITKDDIQDLKNTVKKFVEERNSLILENERLKEENGKQRIRIYKQGQLYLKASDKAYNYKQTLQEIKEIAENAKRDICNNCGWRNTESCDPEDYTCGEFIKILQKITKAEEE